MLAFTEDRSQLLLLVLLTTAARNLHLAFIWMSGSLVKSIL